ncbi:MAG: hypothetical protein BWY76_01411 [bacterium ADurb.Bin429]|nr:MAG: hypothetical protein BWY76_01411 [bacterium ADurb.Bin429]
MQSVVARLRAVAADDHQPLNAGGAQVIHRLLKAFRRAEGLTTRAVQDGAALIDDARDGRCVHKGEIALDQALITVADADHLHPRADARADDGADGGIHAGGIAPAGEHCDTFHY